LCVSVWRHGERLELAVTLHPGATTAGMLPAMSSECTATL